MSDSLEMAGTALLGWLLMAYATWGVWVDRQIGAWDAAYFMLGFWCVDSVIR